MSSQPEWIEEPDATLPGTEGLRRRRRKAKAAPNDQAGANRKPKRSGPGMPPLEIGDDVEIAECVAANLQDKNGRLVFDEGEFWQHNGTAWEPLHQTDLWKAIRAYSGAAFTTPSGEPSVVKMNKSRAESIVAWLANIQADRGFFADAPVGINCKSGFITFAGDGTPSIEPHSPDHRQRHTLPGTWQPGAPAWPPSDSLLATLLKGCFLGDEDAADKCNLLAEAAAAAALGMATRLRNPLAIIMHGKTAENGKSQMQTALAAVLPPSSVCSVSAAEMGDERHIVGLVGKKLNIVGELSGAAIASEKFKAVVTGDPVSGRDVFKSRTEFRPVAQHIFAANVLPAFKGGMDRGVRRRLVVLEFKRTIPKEERIKDIGVRIGKEEPDLLLAWVVAGAARLIRNGEFTTPASSAKALDIWIASADPVLGWLNEKAGAVEIMPAERGLPLPHCRTRDAHAAFKEWAASEGYAPHSLPAAKGFQERVLAHMPGVIYQREPGTGQRHFVGLVWDGVDRVRRNPETDQLEWTPPSRWTP